MVKLDKETLKIFWRHSMQYRLSFFVVWTGLILATVSYSFEPLLIRNVITACAERTPESYEIAKFWLGIVIGRWLLAEVLWRSLGMTHSNYQPSYIASLMKSSFKYLLGHSYSFYLNTHIGSVVTRFKRFSGAGESVDDHVKWNISRPPLQCVMVIVSLFVTLATLPVFGFILTGWSILYMGFAYAFARFKLKYEIEVAEQESAVTAHVADTLTNILSVKVCAAEERELATFYGLTDRLSYLRRRSWRIDQYGEMFQSVITVSLKAGLALFALHYWWNGRLNAGDIYLIVAYVAQVCEPLWDLGRNIRSVYQQLASANEMTEMLLRPHEIVDAPDATTLEVTEGRIEFRGVVYAHGSSDALFDGLDLTIYPGQRVAIVGKSGAGKTTLVNLLFRFHELDGGEILIDGQNIAKVTQSSLRKNVALVAQDTGMFNRELHDNIIYPDPDATVERVTAATEAASCDGFIRRFPKGYNTVIGERGQKLSGGQRQRVAISRAFLANTRIVVFDEATSSLDNKTELEVQLAMERMEGRTTLIIAHRLSTIMRADVIVVLDEGRIVEQGTHSQLLAKRGIYFGLYNRSEDGMIASSSNGASAHA